MDRCMGLLEKLLSLTERFKDQMDATDCDEWQNISAETADLRESMT